MSAQKRAKVADGIYIGDEFSVDESYIRSEKITMIILLSNIKVAAPKVKVVMHTMQNMELLDAEINRCIERLNAVSNTIHDARNNGENVMLCCIDGRNLSPLVAGYYLVSNGNHTNNCNIVNELETIYFSPQQKEALIAEKTQDGANIDPQLLTEILVSRAERNGLKCLTNKSFRKIIVNKANFAAQK